MAFMRKSKFRHIFGKPLKKDQGYDAIRISKSSWETTFCAVNPKFVAVIAETSGGGFLVLPLSKVGRVDMDQPLVCGHTRPVLDIAWSPHNDNVIASCGEDCVVKVWEIPDEGLTEPLTVSLVDLEDHERRVTTVVWHPSAENILLSTGSDYKVIIWNLISGEIYVKLTMPEQLYSVSFNEDGSLFACTCKDKQLRVVDSHTGKIVLETKGHEGSKPQQVAFLKNNKLVTTGFSRMSERQYALWNVGSELKSEGIEDIDSSNGVMFIFYDPDTSIFFLAGKGDSLIRYYEVTDEAPFIHFLSLYQSNAPQRGIGYMPKRGLNVTQHEIARFFKLHNNGFCEVIPFTVPRKSELFQADLYPDTASTEPAMSADDFTSGKNAMPRMMSLKDPNATAKKESKNVIRKSNVLEKRVSSKVASTVESSNNADAAASQTLPPVSEGNKTKTDGLDVATLMKEIESLKATVQRQENRIQELESKVTSLEAQTDEENAGEEDEEEMA